MALFRHALQVCTIACITISIHGHVLFAVNVEDFRNLANQFLTKNLAAQLSQLVSEHRINRRDYTKAGNRHPELDLTKVAELIRDRLLNEYRAPVASTDKVTIKRNIKRFSTVRNTVDMDERSKFTNKFRNPNYETTSPGLVYVKDDLEKLLQINTDDTSSDRTQETLPQDPNNSNGSFEVMREEHAEKQSDAPIKIDYTETKLGEWLFNHILSRKPTKIQNQKFSNSDINDVGNAEETPNERKVQYVYETQLLGRNDKIKQNVQNVAALRPKNKDTHNVNIQDQSTGEHGTIKEHDMIPKPDSQKQITDENYTGSQTKDQEIDKKILPIQENENTFNHGNIAFDQDEGRMPASLEEIKPESIQAKIESSLHDAVEGKHQPLEEHITYDKYILGSKGKDNHPKKPHRQPVGENDTYENGELAQQTDSSNNNRVDPQQVDDSEDKLIQETKKIFNDENIASIKHEADRSSYHDQLLLRNKKRHPVIKSSKNQQYLSDYKEVKSDSVKSKIESSLDDTVEGRDQQEESNIKFTKENYTHRKKPQRKPIEENDLYEKYELGADTKGSNNVKVKPQPDEDNVSKQPIPGMKYKFDHDDVNIEDDEFYNKDKSFGNTERDSSVKFAKHGVSTTKVPIKKEKDDDDLLPIPGMKYKFDHDDVNIEDDEFYNKVKSFGNTERDSSVKLAKHGVSTTKVPIKKEKDDDDLLPAYEAVKLGSSSSDEIKDKKAEEHDIFNKNSFDKYDHPYKPKKQLIEENDMYKTYSLGSKDKVSKDKEVKNDDDKYEYEETVSEKKNKRDHPVRDEHEENDMYEKHSLEKNSNREVKRDYNMYSNKEPDFIKNNEETVLRKKDKGDHRGFDKDEENEMHDKHSLGIKDKNSRDRQDDEIDDDKYGHKETVSGKKTNGDHRVRYKEKENDMYDKLSQGSKDKNSDRENEDDKYGYKETGSGKKKNGNHGVRNKDEENGMYDKYSLGSKDKKRKDKKVENDDDKYGYKESVTGNKKNKNNDEENGMYNKYTLGSKVKKNRDRESKHGYKEMPTGNKNKEHHRQLDKEEENNIYDKYSLGSKDRNSNTEVEKRDNNNYGFKDTVLGTKTRGRGRNKNSGNKDELLLKNKNRHLMKGTNKVKESKDPSEGYAGDPRPDFKEVQPESIKAKTESLLDSVEEKGKPTKHFTMKGTLIPKREFYKLSSPNYYKDLPRIVDKYDFDEPLPEQDRQRDKAGYLKREPSRVNRKLKLPRFEKVKM